MELSNREYLFIMVEQGDKIEVVITLDELLQVDEDKNDYEYIYAIQDDIDHVLDLHVGQSIYFSPDRNYPSSGADLNDPKGILIRIK